DGSGPGMFVAIGLQPPCLWGSTFLFTRVYKGDGMGTLTRKTVATGVAACALSIALAGAGFATPPVHSIGGPFRIGAPLRISVSPRVIAPTSKATPAQKTVATRTTGQPNQTCGSPTAPETPGKASTALGSAFNPTGVAGGVYAGEQPQNSGNP